MLLFTNQYLCSAELLRRAATATKAVSEIKIDGKDTEAAWNNTELLSQFTQYEPANGLPSTFTTKVRMLYNDEGIYVFANLIDSFPDSIAAELGKRDSDNDINADWFSIDLCPFDDGVNGFSFKLTVSGVQTDIKRASGAAGRDVSWDAVWDSETLITEDGWVAEIFIPFSAIRFPVSGDRPWGVNFHRFVARRKEISSWNFTDKTRGNTISQTGLISGMTDINAPVRLSVTPYVSAYVENQSGASREWLRHFNGGMDLKWGFNESFTLDATMVPDFSQVQADDVVLNLSPYEIQYNERRQFFTEGTELFSKGDIFYSRRIGSMPRGYRNAVNIAADSLNIIFNPRETGLINATKISGRTSGGLGIGFFNAMTRRSLAVLEDPDSGVRTEIATEPFTNYNLIVVDQSLKNASYISIINSTVLRNSPHKELNYNATVTAADMLFYTRDRMLSFRATGATSRKYYAGVNPVTGLNIEFSAGKTGGTFLAYFSNKTISNLYDPNDMGYLKRNNLISNAITFSYNIYKPIGPIYISKNSLSFSYDLLYSPRVYNAFTADMISSSTFKNLWTLMVRGTLAPAGIDDYFEPRVTGRMYHRSPFLLLSGTVVTDTRSALLITFGAGLENYYSEKGRRSYSFRLNPSVRFSNRLNAGINIAAASGRNDEGYVGVSGEDVIFGQRDNFTFTGELEASFMFSSKSYLSFRLREYWAKAIYSGTFSLLQPDGSLNPADLSRNDNTNYNAFNIDLNYTWRFAPGSELTIVWKNSVYSTGSYIPASFAENIHNLFNQSMINSISLKLIYYIDYHTLTHRE
jgi:hypothetical protein